VKKWDYSRGINFTIDYSQYSKEKQTKKKTRKMFSNTAYGFDFWYHLTPS